MLHCLELSAISDLDNHSPFVEGNLALANVQSSAGWDFSTLSICVLLQLEALH